MKLEYREWSEAFAKRNEGFVRGMCHWAASDMVKAFPELTLVPGFAHLRSGGVSEHWWCETASGAVVDPTASQFDDQGGVRQYERYIEGKHTIKLGRCHNCGMGIYGKGPEHVYSTSFCDRDCEREVIDSLNAECG